MMCDGRITFSDLLMMQPLVFVFVTVCDRGQYCRQGVNTVGKGSIL